MSRRRPLKHDGEIGLTLYGATPANPKYRLSYTDPFTGERRQPRRTDKAEAFSLFEETLVYLRTARLAAPVGGGRPQRSAPGKRRGATPTVDDLFDARLQRWEDDGCSKRYVDTRQGRYDYRICPVIGELSVREWATNADGCREVLRAARVQGLAPRSVQDLGALMRGLVSLGWELRWIPPAHNPMLGVKYTAGATVQGQGPEYVRPEDRPAFGAVEKLVLAYEELAGETGIVWLAERALVGAHGGLRPGERDALRRCDLRPNALGIAVEWSFEWLRGAAEPLRKRPKNGKIRQVLVPASDMERLVVLSERRRASGAADDSLLFDDPRRPGLPLSEPATRRLHIEAGLRADGRPSRSDAGQTRDDTSVLTFGPATATIRCVITPRPGCTMSPGSTGPTSRGPSDTTAWRSPTASTCVPGPTPTSATALACCVCEPPPGGRYRTTHRRRGAGTPCPPCCQGIRDVEHADR